MKAVKNGKLEYLDYELLNGNGEVLFKGKAPDCLKYYNTSSDNAIRVFWARKVGDSKLVKIDAFIYLCNLIERFLPKQKKSN